MQERVYEILTFLLKKVYSKKQTIDQSLVTQDLVNKGFEIDEIRAAFKILEVTKQLEREEEPPPYKSYRVFNDYEQFRFDLDAQGALIILEQFGIVSPYQLEEIIDRAMAIDLPEISKREIAFVAMQVVAESDGVTVGKDVWNFFDDDNEGVDEL